MSVVTPELGIISVVVGHADFRILAYLEFPWIPHLVSRTHGFRSLRFRLYYKRPGDSAIHVGVWFDSKVSDRMSDWILDSFSCWIGSTWSSPMDSKLSTCTSLGLRPTRITYLFNWSRNPLVLPKRKFRTCTVWLRVDILARTRPLSWCFFCDSCWQLIRFPKFGFRRRTSFFFR